MKIKSFWLGSAFMTSLCPCQRNAAAALDDRAGIIDAINEIGLSADMRDWKQVRAQFADEVFADYTSLVGGQPGTVKADELVSGWKAFLPGFTATQHIITNHRVTVSGDEAQSLSQFVANHRLADAAGGELWTLGGYYRHTLRRTRSGWKVTRMTMTWTWQTGNTDLPKLAGEAVKRYYDNHRGIPHQE